MGEGLGKLVTKVLWDDSCAGEQGSSFVVQGSSSRRAAQEIHSWEIMKLRDLSHILDFNEKCLYLGLHLT